LGGLSGSFTTLIGTAFRCGFKVKMAGCQVFELELAGSRSRETGGDVDRIMPSGKFRR